MDVTLCTRQPGANPLHTALHITQNSWLPERWVYQAALTPFLAFYALFGAVLYPNAELLHPTHLLDTFRAALPGGGRGYVGDRDALEVEGSRSSSYVFRHCTSVHVVT
jgi:hypothetical protein